MPPDSAPLLSFAEAYRRLRDRIEEKDKDKNKDRAET